MMTCVTAVADMRPEAICGFDDLRHCRKKARGAHSSVHGSHHDNHLESLTEVRVCPRGRGIMSATIIPWRPRTPVAIPQPTVYLPALINGQITMRALIAALATAGLVLLYDSNTG